MLRKSNSMALPKLGSSQQFPKASTSGLMPTSEDAESSYAKAVQSEFSKDYDSAFRLYIKAAESFLHLSRSVGHDREKVKWKSSAGKALERAEKIKAFVDKSNDLLRSETRLTPVGVDHFSPQEQSYAVKKGGIINGRLFPLWDESFPSNTSTSALFEDPDGEMGLSPEQSKVLPVWRRPAVSEGDGAIADWRLRPRDILQHIITDCSVCASISVCLEHNQRFGHEHIRLFSPQAALEIGVGLMSMSDRAQGRYDLRLLFNGAWRRCVLTVQTASELTAVLGATVIDDKLPHHPTTGALVCMSSVPVHGQSITWPSLLEKGFMKLMGGYDFPGSNSSIDLHTLVGWIPEHLETKSPTFEREATWTRIVDAFHAGQCMLTVGTGVNPDINWRGAKLLASHNYAVIDVTEDPDASRAFTILDSWVGTPDESVVNMERTSGILKIPWTDVLEIFDSVYLSWDPAIWPTTLSFHGTWKQTDAGDRRSTRHLRLKFDNPNHTAQSEVWILLTRHVADTRRTSDFISLRVQLQDEVAGSTELGDPRKIAEKGTYTNSTHVLSKTSLPVQTSGLLSVFAAYDGQTAEVGFTLSVYAPAVAKLAWDESVPTPPFTSKVEGTLTSKNAGGNSTHPTFMVNPQYYLRIHPPKHSPSSVARKADVSLAMQVGREVPVNITVAWSQGGRIFELAQKDLAATSGAYSYGLARLTKPLQAGDYTIILSAFEPNQLGAFSLEVESSLAFDLKAIPQEGAGMYAKTVRGAWTAQNAMGGPSFKHYVQNPGFEIDVQAPTELKIRLQLLRPKAPAALNLTLFPAPAVGTSGALGRHVTTSGRIRRQHRWCCDTANCAWGRQVLGHPLDVCTGHPERLSTRGV
ncbi:Calpain catalytic domain-containing protein [Mycena sanguinolenta]|uniref:Calpain catalytic domain-containing protein n=1 Tax=Mycena sanguinolenta TaxID=230812 RepID=A0A8H7CWP6_9AGAR|nr:Calpain catalytic domain-containing protein [Mycena sanguinolenta]